MCKIIVNTYEFAKDYLKYIIQIEKPQFLKNIFKHYKVNCLNTTLLILLTLTLVYLELHLSSFIENSRLRFPSMIVNQTQK